MVPGSQSHASDGHVAGVELDQSSFFPGRDPGRHDLATTIDEFHQMLGGIKNDLVGRENLVDQLGYALLTREHQLIVGPAGVGKSLYARSAFSRIRDDRPGYYISLTNETSKGELFGGLNLEEFEKGRYIYNTEGYITQAHFAILNEMFDAPVKLLRTLNDVLNERVFESGPQREAVRLLSAIALSNYLASGQAAEAVLDRFIFKATVGASTTPTERYQLRKHFLVSHGKVRTIPDEEKLDVDKLLFLSEVIHGENSHHPLSYSRSVLVLLDAIFAEYESRYEGTFGGDSEVGRFEISDRTKNKSLHLLGASALLSGRTETKPRIFEH